MRSKCKSKRGPNGYIIYQDEIRVIIATGFRRKSQNKKTGPMIQVWILARKQNPMRAVKTGHNRVVCGNCPVMDACYVEVAKAPAGVWKAYRRGRYPVAPNYEIFAGRKVRFGAYGDPIYIPFTILAGIAATAKGWTGYTHQWRNPLYGAYKRFLMASVEHLEGYELAQSQGWRTFRVTPVNELRAVSGEIVCPNTTRGISCADCLLCAGQSRPAKSIVIEGHGARKKKLRKLAA